MHRSQVCLKKLKMQMINKEPNVSLERNSYTLHSESDILFVSKDNCPENSVLTFDI